jgi:hypothetical protein
MIAFLSINFNKSNYKNLIEPLLKTEYANNSYFELLLKLIFFSFYLKFGVEINNLSSIISFLCTKELEIKYKTESGECKKHIETYGFCPLC